MTETIVAPATAMIAQPIGIVRLSGPQSLAIAKKVTAQSLQPRRAYFGKLFSEKEIIDHGLVIYFKAPHSFTGEDVVEFQVHGNAYVLSQVVATCLSLGAVMAEPGAFSKRAYLNGKMSLDQAEAVADLISASSHAAAKSAVKSLEGGLKNRIMEIQKALMDLRVQVEASIDFSDEDIPSISDEDIFTEIEAIDEMLEKLISQAKRGAQLQKGIHIALVGEPNAGKSTLMNAICQQDVSIVTEEAGTTRDVVSRDIVYKGVGFYFSDTAGIRATDSEAEKAGIDRSYQSMEEADLVLWIKDATIASDFKVKTTTPVWVVENKVDLLSSTPPGYAISAKSGQGVEALLDGILSHFQLNASQEPPFSARERHIDILNRAKQALPYGSLPSEIMAQELLHVQNILSEITGEVSVDDMLSVLFSEFCIGK